MKRNILFSCIFIYFLVSSCERIIVLDDGDEGIRGLVVNAVATTDTVFMASVSYAYFTDDAPYVVPREYGYFDFSYYLAIFNGYDDIPDGFTKYGMHEDENLKPGGIYFPWGGEYQSVRDSIVNERYLVRDARVTLTVNENAEYPMTYEPKSARYVSSYVPRIGDHLRVTAEKDGKKVIGETSILKPQKLEILDYELIHKEAEDFVVGKEGIYSRSDTVIRVTLRITDPGDERNYYRLKVQNVREKDTSHAILFIGPHWHYIRDQNKQIVDSVYYEKTEEPIYAPLRYWLYEDVYTSDDVIFYDPRLTRRWGAWEPYMSNVFDDHLINGEEYTIQVESRMFKGRKPKRFLVVELQSIPEDYYHYLKSMMVYRITSDDDFSENVYVHSNVKNGWGIVGSLSSEKYMIELD